MDSEIKRAREKRGLMQEEVAKQAGISWRAYQNYEAGKRKPKSDVAIRIANVLGVKSYEDFKKLFG